MMGFFCLFVCFPGTLWQLILQSICILFDTFLFYYFFILENYYT